MNTPLRPPLIERRKSPDRRQRPTSPFSRFLIFGRRAAGRRAGERENIYVDRHTSREWWMVIGIFVLSIADLFLTLHYIDAGGEEANPLMRWTLERSEMTFALVKGGITAIGVVFLIIHSRFHRVRWCIDMLFVLYCMLIVYHMWLRITTLPPA